MVGLTLTDYDFTGYKYKATLEFGSQPNAWTIKDTKLILNAGSLDLEVRSH